MRRPEIRKAEIDIDSASFQIEFAQRPTTAHAMADSFADCVREAILDSSNATRISELSTEWLALTAYSISGDVSLWETQEATAGHVRLNHPVPRGNHSQLSELAEAISRIDEVEQCQATSRPSGLTIDFRHKNRDLNGFLDAAEQRFEILLANHKQAITPGQRDGSATGHAVEVATGPRRVMYLVLAGGAFAMTIVGLILPGIPTVPFLLATSYFLARSSRRLNQRLSDSILFGSIVSEWKAHGALSRASKAKLLALTAVILAVTVIVGPLSLISVAFLIVVSSLSVLGIVHLPSLPEEERESTAGNRLALATR